MIAFVFPGQGSQAPGMGRDVAEAYPAAREVFAQADAALGFGLSEICHRGSRQDLALTANTQPAILSTSVALLRALGERGRRPDFVAGHSLGEYSALVAAGALEFTDAVRLVRRRGRFMQEAVPVGKGSMAAILGLGAGPLEEVCREAAQGQVVSAANLNSPQQVVIAGHRAAVDRACRLARSRGARRALRLPVSAPFHCALMEPARQRLKPILEETRFADLACPLINNVDGRAVTAGAEARDGLIRQVTAPVQWRRSVEALWEMGARTFVEVGPGRVLSRLIRQIVPGAETMWIGNRAEVESYV